MIYFEMFYVFDMIGGYTEEWGYGVDGGWLLYGWGVGWNETFKWWIFIIIIYYLFDKFGGFVSRNIGNVLLEKCLI